MHVLDDDVVAVDETHRQRAELLPEVVDVEMSQAGRDHVADGVDDVRGHRDGGWNVRPLDEVVAVPDGGLHRLEISSYLFIPAHGDRQVVITHEPDDVTRVVRGPRG